MKNLNNYIEQEKNREPSPLLVDRIIPNLKRDDKHFAVFQRIAMAASIAAMITIGVAIGNTYQPKQQETSIIQLNDSHMEHFHVYKDNKNG